MLSIINKNMFQLNKESGYIEEVKDVEVNVNCIICDGTGLMSDVLEGDNTVCLCIVNQQLKHD